GRLPQREQEMVSLTRDYDNLKKAYDDLLAKKLGAKVSQNLEVGQKGETFQMIDPPNLPTTPFKPDRLKILGISLLAAIAIGLGGAAGREMLDPALQGPKDFKYFFEYPILASLPVIQAEGPNRARRNLRTALLIGLCSLLSVVAAVLLIYRDAIRNVLQITGGIG
ncbi:MAG: GNVR domain-containing protein, partial [Deltaproteobacteria bacterium]